MSDKKPVIQLLLLLLDYADVLYHNITESCLLPLNVIYKGMSPCFEM